jgi:hypothetical protein
VQLKPIVTSICTLYECGLSQDIINEIVELAYDNLRLVCDRCGRLSKCSREDCDICLWCNRHPGSISLCRVCIDDGWYRCANHSVLGNDDKGVWCMWCMR